MSKDSEKLYTNKDLDRIRTIKDGRKKKVSLHLNPCRL